MSVVIRPARRLRGVLTMPGDKSISHRAVLFNALTAGIARVDNFLPGADCQATVQCVQALGAEVVFETDQRLTVRGAGRLREPVVVLDAANSGTTARLLAGILAGQPFFSVLSGDASLCARPMGRVVAPLWQMGARIQGRCDATLAPLAITGGGLTGIDFRLPVASAQLKSALLLAGLFADGTTTVHEPVPSRDHTERMLSAMGAKLDRGNGSISVRRSELAPLDCSVPGDISAAAFWLVAAAAHPDADLVLHGVGVNPTRTGILDVLRAMGASITALEERTVGGEPVADLHVQSAALHGVEIGGSLIPRLIDELPALAVAASFARGQTVIRDAAELRTKESDRIATTAAELRKAGVFVEERPDGLTIEGGKPMGASFVSYGDHRLAMATATLGLLASGESRLEDAEAVRVSYPEFWQDFITAGGGLD